MGEACMLYTLGQRIRELREDLGLSQRELADKVSSTRGTIANWETGRATPDISDVERLADFFGVSLYYLLGRSNEKQGEAPVYPPNVIPASGHFRLVPVIGTIPAGVPLLAVEEESEKMPFPEELLPQGNVFFLNVRGDSMQEERIYDGDMVLINADEQVNDMDIGAVLVDDEEVTLKKVHYVDGSVVLLPANPQYRPSIHPAEEVRILGRYRYAIRR